MEIRLAPLLLEALPGATALLARACPYYEGIATVAGEKLFGPSPDGADPLPIAAYLGSRLAGVAVFAGRWLRLLAVEPELWGRGVGTALLEEALRLVRSRGDARLRLMDQPGNYLAPGVDERDEHTLGWFARRGFLRLGVQENLAVLLRGNPLVTAGRAAELSRRVAQGGYQVGRATPEDRPALLDFVERAFGRAWAFEVSRALENDPPAVHVARTGGAIVAFAVHDGNNRGLGWFGPAGTHEAHRERGLGQALLVPCLIDVAAAGRFEATIAWIGPRRYYERTVGVAGARRFAAMEMLL